MKSRNELAHDYLCAMLANPALCTPTSMHPLRKWALAEADASLAACGEKPQEREPDAVWTLTAMEQSPTPRLAFDESYGIALSPEVGNRLLAGRDQVKLAVRVVED